jgi:hypothetical protein
MVNGLVLFAQKCGVGSECCDSACSCPFDMVGAGFIGAVLAVTLVLAGLWLFARTKD